MTPELILEGMTTADFFDTMGKRIRILREDKRLNQTEMARRMAELGASVAPSYLSQIEGDTKVPSLPVFKAITLALETTTDYLLLLSDDPFPTSDDEPDSGHGISEEAQRIAGMVDMLPAWRRQELLQWLESVVSVSEAARTEARAAAELLRQALGLDGVLSPQTMALIEAAFLRYVAGRVGSEGGAPVPGPAPLPKRRRNGAAARSQVGADK